ncbi:MAG: aminodeoxychorismate/anthranilate synthase component II [Bacteroidales bacterium]|jgi:anthranilate synthase component 2|nr:aminodeoxychorismate/anthranilate synthase component II [Bacteroidales bacterium]HOI32122.1 aminodeoxychorismate/anthranilate synthase component II [Bacteroidales bacterium]
MRILLIDNFDSFTYNLVQLLRESGVKHELQIIKNTIELSALPAEVDKVLISPGPGIPEESGNLMAMIGHYVGRKPVLGICLGHQALALHFGAKMLQLPHSFHGADHMLHQSNSAGKLFEGVPPKFIAGRYHSWIIDHETLPEELLPTAYDEAGRLMAFRHAHWPVDALQFHPESYMTFEGWRMMQNWLKM